MPDVPANYYENKCKRCKRVGLLKPVKYVKCDAFYHLGCANSKRYKIMENNQVDCCTPNLTIEEDANSELSVNPMVISTATYYQVLDDATVNDIKTYITKRTQLDEEDVLVEPIKLTYTRKDSQCFRVSVK
ncbi:hypothetical protein ABEB36_002421 [Hypothenemus hampei]|uniref:Uncharacterized protein n=1 Tax=Hypothenemus hampei TaxID=57062 RepID=A0ABD1F5S2_HYPHA